VSTSTVGHALPASFRDPSGFLFRRGEGLYRQVNMIYREHYARLMSSGLYDNLVEAGLLVRHREVDVECPLPESAYLAIQPELVPFISYPYEWCFSQLRDAALTTLEVARRALRHNMSLKDCTAFNVQFLRGKPVFIDTLSFEKYQEGKPWVAYRQFCEHFLAPLALMSYTDIRLNQLFRPFIHGIPLDLASTLLPAKTRFRFSLLTHIHLHKASQKQFADRKASISTHRFSRRAFLGLLDSLESAIRGLPWKASGSEWGQYYSDTNYNDESFEQKRRLVAEYLELAQPETVWDLGGNTGHFSRIASDQGITTLCCDIDPDAVEANYRRVAATGEEHILPLVMDLTNPSAGSGWGNQERDALQARGPADTVMALALIHHLAISNNVPLEMVARFFRDTCRHLIIEFVPKSDSQVQRLLATREDIFPDYRQECFEADFSRYFNILHAMPIPGSERTLYLMQRRDAGYGEQRSLFGTAPVMQHL
jgi:ribosomal protein L11 methylase PrmA